ncbi:Rap1a/Tai family immunity protein [Klebsiella aerogenes]|uniref:Rap1a/Tai family immunity protein n=1 Tax=Klebsiella aerogenes TaxID=548 RepID=UPI002278649D|nr:Rap1a/Tai family immunity protein [Klebsiella aerogenes]MCY4765225.1 hypothetical protein [Klebsiella aerogenes]
MKRLIIGLAILVSFNACANFYDGNDLKKWSMALTKSNLGSALTPSEAADGSMFQGYVAGVYELGEGSYFCTPDRTRLIQLTDAVTNYINKHPELRSNPASNLTEQALIESFPCKK